MGKWRGIIPIVLALVIAVSASFYLYKWLKSQTAPKQVVKVEAEGVPVTVAAVDLKWGTKLEKDMLKQVAFLQESLPPGYVSESELLENRVIIVKLQQNEAITESKLAPKDVTVGGVSAVLEHGKRAIAVKGNKVIGISGFILPGNRVDVLVTLKDPSTKSELTKIVLENINVLATGTEVQNNAKGDPAPVDVYTLEVTPEEGEKLALAAAKGKLQFALRNAMDTETVLTKGATIKGTLASYKQVTHRAPPPKATEKRRVVQPRVHTVEVIKDGKVIKEKFRL